MLEIINSCLCNSLHHNPNLVYALLYKRELFEQFRTHPSFQDIMQNLDTVSGLGPRQSPRCSILRLFKKLRGLLKRSHFGIQSGHWNRREHLISMCSKFKEAWSLKASHPALVCFAPLEMSDFSRFPSWASLTSQGKFENAWTRGLAQSAAVLYSILRVLWAGAVLMN